ncbi:hypothetical protein HUSEC41_25712, partial [Escherichia coli O104:H4 str. 01-09591]
IPPPLSPVKKKMLQSQEISTADEGDGGQVVVIGR